ncbi:4-hydroxybenzoate octaprenyltransferase [Gammaproteobacteria bacterium LSUCC0112]|nr:4-hydroxybenzoate octaprenyltransferase [Gammaproteobacteria bacterium LSUCC0112]
MRPPIDVWHDIRAQLRVLVNKSDRWLARTFPVAYARAPAFILLTRANKPIGTYLLLWPTLSALWLAAGGWPDWHLILIFALGTWLMRSAGCCINDFADAAVDGQVKRTEGRAIVTGQVSRREAFVCFLVLCLLSAVLLLFLNTMTMLLSLGAVALTFLYPFMKRYTHLPQVVLGMAFSWGILMAFTAQTETLPAIAWVLYVANCLWTVAYDTQYAMVDREYDLQIGVKSTAILFGDADKVMIGMLQGMFVLALLLVGRSSGLNLWYYLGVFAASILLVYQQLLIRDRQPDACFRAFLNNHWVGLAVFVGVVIGV